MHDSSRVVNNSVLRLSSSEDITYSEGEWYFIDRTTTPPDIRTISMSFTGVQITETISPPLVDEVIPSPGRGSFDVCWQCGEPVWAVMGSYTCDGCDVFYRADFKAKPTPRWTRWWWKDGNPAWTEGLLRMYHVRARDVIDHQTCHVPSPA